MEDIFENVKRIKVFGEFLSIISNNKMVFKDMNKPDQHHTMKFGEDGILDIHTTKEGSEKSYQSNGKVDLIKVVKEMVENPQFLADAMQEFVNALKPVTFEEKEYSHLKVAPSMTKEKLSELAERKKRDMIFSPDKINEFQMGKNQFSWNDTKGKIVDQGFVFDSEEMVGVIMMIEGRPFYMSMEIMQHNSITKLIEKMTLSDQIDYTANKDSN
ncbi:hypothetical protein [Nitrosopumilus sp.]|uniref:hypothetical protein n=1 Tax=Nitrosopumilus sp. TaxID=2024843 RepID=UPI00247D27A3|nr:hypothetical protein [Nitrosopumilus sp.]MCV0431482.1 hypothetical protein [Nitrosopumilus sp.]